MLPASCEAEFGIRIGNPASQPWRASRANPEAESKTPVAGLSCSLDKNQVKCSGRPKAARQARLFRRGEVVAAQRLDAGGAVFEFRDLAERV